MQFVIDYLNTKSRNKIVFHKKDIPEITSFDIGLNLSKAIKSLVVNKHFTLNVEAKLEKLLVKNTLLHPKYGQLLSIKNLGILFEPSLKINFTALIDKYSKNTCLFIKWGGEIENNKLYFLSKENGIELDIKNLSHIVI